MHKVKLFRLTIQPMLDVDQVEAIEMLHAKGYGASQIARKVKCSPETVERWVRKLKAGVRGYSRRKR